MSELDSIIILPYQLKAAVRFTITQILTIKAFFQIFWYFFRENSQILVRGKNADYALNQFELLQ